MSRLFRFSNSSNFAVFARLRGKFQISPRDPCTVSAVSASQIWSSKGPMCQFIKWTRDDCEPHRRLGANLCWIYLVLSVPKQDLQILMASGNPSENHRKPRLSIRYLYNYITDYKIFIKYYKCLYLTHPHIESKHRHMSHETRSPGSHLAVAVHRASQRHPGACLTFHANYHLRQRDQDDV